jgi:hypothetical protein
MIVVYLFERGEHTKTPNTWCSGLALTGVAEKFVEQKYGSPSAPVTNDAHFSGRDHYHNSYPRYPPFSCYGATPVTVQMAVSVSPAGGYGGWLYGAGVTSSATRVKTLSPINEPSAGIVVLQEVWKLPPAARLV